MLALNPEQVLLRFGDLEDEPPRKVLEMAARGEQETPETEFKRFQEEEREKLFQVLDWALYNERREEDALATVNKIKTSVSEIQTQFALLEESIEAYERVVRDIDGDLKSKISEYTQLQTLLHFYDLSDSEYYRAFERSDCSELLPLVNRDGIQSVISIFGKLDDAISSLSRSLVAPKDGDGGGGGGNPAAHPETEEYIKSYCLTRLQGLKMLSDTAERTLETIVTKLAKQLVPFQHDAQAVMNRRYRDSESIIASANFLPTNLAHVKFRVMGRSIQPITTMLKDRATHNEVADYLHHLNRLWLSYSGKRLRLVQSAFSRQVAYLMERRAEGQGQMVVANLRAACLYWFDYALNEHDSFYFYFPTSRWVNPDRIISTLAADFYDVLRSYIIGVHDIATLRSLSNETHRLIDVHLQSLQDTRTSALLPPMEAIRRDIKNKLTSRIHEIFIRNISASYICLPSVEELPHAATPNSRISDASEIEAKKREVQDETLTPVRSLQEMLQLLTDTKIGHTLHLPVINSAINSLEKIDTILDNSVVSLLSTEISSAVESKLTDAVSFVTKHTGKPLLGSLLACRELLCLHQSLGASLFQASNNWDSPKSHASGSRNPPSPVSPATDDNTISSSQLPLWLSKATSQAYTQILLEYKDAASPESLDQAFSRYLEAVSEFLLSTKYDPLRPKIESFSRTSTNKATITNLFVLPVFHHILRTLELSEVEREVLEARLNHWRDAQ